MRTVTHWGLLVLTAGSGVCVWECVWVRAGWEEARYVLPCKWCIKSSDQTHSRQHLSARIHSWWVSYTVRDPRAFTQNCSRERRASCWQIWVPGMSSSSPRWCCWSWQWSGSFWWFYLLQRQRLLLDSWWESRCSWTQDRRKDLFRLCLDAPAV